MGFRYEIDDRECGKSEWNSIRGRSFLLHFIQLSHVSLRYASSSFVCCHKSMCRVVNRIISNIVPCLTFSLFLVLI